MATVVPHHIEIRTTLINCENQERSRRFWSAVVAKKGAEVSSRDEMSALFGNAIGGMILGTTKRHSGKALLGRADGRLRKKVRLERVVVRYMLDLVKEKLP